MAEISNRAVLVRLLMNQATRAGQAGRGRQALELFRRMTVMAPGYGQARWERARLKPMDGDFAATRDRLTAMLEIMRDAEVLILDEPTAALDARAEYEVFQRFRELSAGRSAVLISHRFSSVRMADRILVLGDGQVEASGTHAELLAAGGRYAEVFELQAAEDR